VNARLALAIAAAAVLVTIVYLFVEVNSAPADVTPPHATEARPAPRPAATLESTGPGSAWDPGPHGQVGKPVVAPPDVGAIPHFEQPELAGEGSDDQRANPKADALMDQASKAYDRQDFDEARTIAGKVLAKQPNNVRMLRIMVSSSCIDGDSITAQKYYAMLPKFDRDQMKARCDRYGVSFTDSP
jgi:hypothetical protein